MDKEKILLVDSDENSLETLKKELNQKYDIDSANDLDSTLYIVENNRPNLILLDVQLPETSGYEVANILKANAMTSEIPIIFLTILNDDECISKIFESGGVGYIIKPIHKVELLSKVKNTLQLFRLRDSLSNALGERQEHINMIENQLDIIDKHVPRITLNLQKQIIDVSTAYCELLEINKDDVIGKRNHCLNPEDNNSDLHKNIFKTIEEKGNWRGELEIESSSGNKLWFDTTVSYDLNCFEKIRGYIATFTNITDAKLIEQKNKKLDEINFKLEDNISYLNQFKKAVEEASIFSITDHRGVITEVNKNFQNISGYSEEELLGQPHNIVRHPDMPKEAFKDMWDTIQSGSMWKGLVKNRRKDGKAYYVISEIAPIYNQDGSLKEYIGIRIDVTELEEYKNILKNELDTKSKSLEENINYTAQYEEAINSTTAISKSDIDGTIIYANEKFCELSGYTIDELKTKKCSELKDKKHIEDNTCKEIKDRLTNKEIVKATLTNINKSGERYITKNLFYPIIDLHNNVSEHLQIMYDITELVKLNEDIINTQKEVVLTMGAIGETRSKETGQHVKRVSNFTYLLAKLYGLNDDEANLLKQASPMHDIGKVGIPDSILKKPAKLTLEEYEIMKTHAEIGYDMLKHSDRDILKTSAEISLTHHEKYDGSGYPRGLKGEEIPISGRITAIADVFDALGHDRVYKKAWELDRILEFFKEEKGKHFDPKLVDLLIENLDKFLEVKNSLKD
ncbi:PAS domain S-box protein [Sulfurimonas sp.]|uniref:PAS domain S-box protein n=1 Tax=Sulfurimonas sp. TaxID=2022749 RepID=UPI00356727F8